MRNDIVRLIEAENDITNAIVLTHNIDFVFIQSVVLPALSRCGHPSLTIFADAQCAAESYQYQHMVLDSLGTRFRVVPVAMNPGFRFHPKAVLLSGQQKGVLLVGSGNLTFGGWRENAETWCRFDSATDGTAPFSAFYEYLESVLRLTPLKDSLSAEVNECFDARLRPWAQDMDPPAGLLGRPSVKDCLVDQMKDVLQGKPVRSLKMHSAYFDDGGHALNRLATEFGANIHVAAQVRRSGLSIEASQALDESIRIQAVNFQHRAADDNVREAFIHTKWYAFEHPDSYTVFLGSANCSQAALTIPGQAGNAELMMYASLTKSEFEANFTDELEFLEVDPQLSSLEQRPDSDTEETPDSSLHIQAARLSDGCLQVAFACPANVSLQGLVIDGNPIDFVLTEPGVVVVNGVPADCRQVSLRGTAGSQVICSNLHWIDHEQSLSTTARSRSVIDAVRTKVQTQSWNIGAWADIGNIFLRNLQYMPQRMGERRVQGAAAARAENVQRHFTAEDVFSDSYGLPSPHSMSIPLPSGFDERVTSLRQLLMRWFGYRDEPDAEDFVGPGDGNGDGNDPADRPETPPRTARPPDTETRDVSESDRKRALKILGMVTDQMTSDTYLKDRPPETLSVDIQFASVLVRTGLNEGWINADEFFDSTHQIWVNLFFTSGPDPTRGWLELRYSNSDEPDDFVRRLVSPKLTAALAAWVFALPEEMSTPARRRFSLSTILSVARLPWLWHFEDGEEVVKELQGLLFSSAGTSNNLDWTGIEARWVKMMRTGHALRMLEYNLTDKTPGDLKGQISQSEVKRGDFLWQGAGGLCVATEDFVRADDKCNTTILYLQKSQSTGAVRTYFAIPVRALLSEGFLDLPDVPAQTLAKYFEDLSMGNYLNENEV